MLYCTIKIFGREVEPQCYVFLVTGFVFSHLVKEDFNTRIKQRDETLIVLFCCRIICQLGRMKTILILSRQELLTFINLLKNSVHKTLVKDGVVILMEFLRTLFYQNLLIHSLPLLLILRVKMRMKFFLSSEENQTVGRQVLMSAKLQQVSNNYFLKTFTGSSA